MLTIYDYCTAYVIMIFRGGVGWGRGIVTFIYLSFSPGFCVALFIVKRFVLTRSGHFRNRTIIVIIIVVDRFYMMLFSAVNRLTALHMLVCLLLLV